MILRKIEDFFLRIFNYLAVPTLKLSIEFPFSFQTPKEKHFLNN